MKRIKHLCILVAILLGLLVGSLTAWIGVRHVGRQRDVALAQPVIREFGGDLMSLPCEPLGSDYYIAFRNRRFSRHELGRLKAIDPMTRRDWVGVKFENCELSTEELGYVAQLLPFASVITLVDKDGNVTAESKPLSRPN